MRSMVFADLFLSLKMRLQSDTVTIRPATSNITTAISKNSIWCFSSLFFIIKYRAFSYIFYFLLLIYSRLFSFSSGWVTDTLSSARFHILTVLTHKKNNFKMQ